MTTLTVEALLQAIDQYPGATEREPNANEWILRRARELAAAPSPQQAQSSTKEERGTRKVTDEDVERALKDFDHFKEAPNGMYIDRRAGMRAALESFAATLGEKK